MLLGIIRSEEEEKAHLFSSLYSKGLTTEQIGEISQEIYGRYYSKQQVSFLARGCKSEVDAWLLRSLPPLAICLFTLTLPTSRLAVKNESIKRLTTRC